MRRVRSQFLQSVSRLSFAVRNHGVANGAAVASSSRGSSPIFVEPASAASTRGFGRTLTVSMALALTALVCLLAFVATAKAEIVHFQEAFSPINGTGDAVLQKPFAIAIDEATGNVFVGETDGRNQVSILGAQGGAPVDLLSPFTVTGFNASGTNQFRAGAVAYDDDPSSPGFGNLYIPDTVAGNVARKVRIYTRNLVTERVKVNANL